MYVQYKDIAQQWVQYRIRAAVYKKDGPYTFNLLWLLQQAFVALSPITFIKIEGIIHILCPKYCPRARLVLIFLKTICNWKGMYLNSGGREKVAQFSNVENVGKFYSNKIRKTEGNSFAWRTRFFFGDQILLTGRCKFPEQSRPCFLHELRPRMWKGSDLARKFFSPFAFIFCLPLAEEGVKIPTSAAASSTPKPANKRKKKKESWIIPKPKYVSYFQAPHKPSPNLPGTPTMDDGLYPAIFPLY